MSPTQSIRLLVVLTGLVSCDRPVDAGAPVADVPASPWIAAQGALDPAAEIFASCASCHMADGSGRAEGTVPRLAGQLESVLVHKLQKLQAGAVTLPVMQPYARSLTAGDVDAVAHYIAQLPVPEFPRASTTGESGYRAYCVSCHGPSAEGNAALLAPRLCGQHAAYITRRMDEIALNRRGDADPAMAGVVQVLSAAQGQEISDWLARGHCASEVQP